ncbi:ATP-binding protein [Larkinella terrae]|uniref:histidine kinase n=1 Tax=Larkinella terrae TaxID=2025311 RepID=A0A7K0EEM9_9BACT|nr:ATP-binding protein [Larkinella terrae]MRS59918.1 PAS domain S-box protein [Larkinella terrae]
MYKLAEFPLNYEQDLVLVHKRALKLGELAGLPLMTRTTFATAVSEVSRDALQYGIDASLTLGITPEIESKRCIVAKINDHGHQIARQKSKRLDSATRLVDDFRISKSGNGLEVRLYIRFPASQCVNEDNIEHWKKQFNTESTESPNDEIKRKNSQLQDLAERFRTSERQYQLLTDSLPFLIFTATAEGKVLNANNWLKKYTGESVAQLNKTKWATVIHEDDADDWWSHWGATAPAGNTFRTEIRIRNAETGAYAWHQVTATALRGEKNTILSWSVVLMDTNAQKMVERTLKDNQELIEAKQKLEQSQHELKLNIGELNRSNQELAEFAYVASHDLQEPLRKIQSFGSLLVEQFTHELSPPAQDLVHRMHVAAERMHVLIKDLLTYSRLNTHHQPFSLVDLNVLLQEVLEDLEMTIREKEARIEFKSLPKIQGNPVHLRQMFQNLLSNAMKFMSPDRTPHIRIFAQEVSIFEIPAPMRQREPSYLAISIEDNGIGFDERYHNRIFQLFQRLHSKDQYSGTGIGLTICKKVAEMHGGTIAALSQPGQGTTFTVYLPQSVVVTVEK